MRLLSCRFAPFLPGAAKKFPTAPRRCAAKARALAADQAGMSDGQEHLTVLVPPCPAMDLSTITSGLHDAAARESVARLLSRELLP